jgi:uncharacterized protein YceH (UPF0502 family)
MTLDVSSPHTSGLPEIPPLSLLEVRVLGCLIEKEFTTPDVYPLSLNALVNACNQRNNRAPLLSVESSDVESALDALRQRRLAALVVGGDARVPKFKQTLDSVYPLDPLSRALLGELLLRGPQTGASLRANSDRFQLMPPVLEVESLLSDLAERAGGALVRKLPRQPGQKESRWAHLLSGEPATSAETASAAEPLTVTTRMPPEIEHRLAALEAEISQVRGELNALKHSLGV